MKKIVLSFFVMVCLLFGLAPQIALADEAATTYKVNVTVKRNNTALSYVSVMITQNGETITYGTTNRSGVVTFDLSDGIYTATVGYVSGNYSYYGTTEIIVNGADVSTTINVDTEFSKEAAKEIYDRTTYYDHVDIRVNGTFTTGTTGNLITHSITLKNVKLFVKDGDTTLIDTSFTDNTETYEWRVTGKRIPNTAVISLIFDIVLDGKTVRENYAASFSGEEEFIQAIINCDQNQGLDFIIDPTEIVSAALYDVSYVWTGLPEGLAQVPATTEHAPDTTHIIDTNFSVGDVIVDEDNKVMYTFSGWLEWSSAEDNHATKNDIGTITSLTITNDTIIYGVWTSTSLVPTSNYIIIEKIFSGNDGRLPENLLFRVTDSNTGTTYVIDISLSSFSYDSVTEVYTYKLPIYTAGTYVVEEFNYTILGYTFDTLNSTNTMQEVVTDLTEEEKVTFKNVYTKNKGIDFHNSGFIVEKADATDRTALGGAVFTLTNSLGETVDTVTSNDSGYAIFMNLTEGVYTLKEINAPSGYHLDTTEYTIIVTLVSFYEVYSATQNAYLIQYDYSVTITPNEHYNSNGTRLTVFNEKITGSITIKKDFATDSKINGDNLPSTSEIKVQITGPEDYNQIVTLNKTNNWIITLNDLVLGKYTIEELVNYASVDGYTLNTTYTNGSNVTSSTMELNLTDTKYDENITITNAYTKIPEDIHNDASFSVKKTDENGNVLSGATFGLYDSNNELVETRTTDKTGIVTFNGFNKEATYILKEISAPTYYNKVNNEWIVVVALENGKPSTESGDNVYNWYVTIDTDDYKDNTLIVVNEKMVGSLTITKEVEYVSDGEFVSPPEDAKGETYSFIVTIGKDTYTIELKAGESYTFENVEYGTDYEVVENIPEDATWEHAAPTNANGTIITEETIVNMVNTYTIDSEPEEDDKEDDNEDDKIDEDPSEGSDNADVPQTGINSSIQMYSIITLFGIVGLIFTIVKYRRNY